MGKPQAPIDSSFMIEQDNKSKEDDDIEGLLSSDNNDSHDTISLSTKIKKEEK